MRRLALINTTGLNDDDDEFVQFFLVTVVGGGSHAQLSTKITVYFKYIWCLVISKVDMLGQYFSISQILA